MGKDMPTLHAGHRQRIIEKLKSSADGLYDHEILEIVLFGIIPRKNTNDIAHRLIAAFGSLSGVFNATFEQLTTVDGIGENAAAYLYSVSVCLKRIRNAANEAEKPESLTSAAIGEYFIKHYCAAEKEFLELYNAREDGRLSLIERFTSHDANHVSVAPERVNLALTSAKPNNLIVVHNHPSGRAAPSDKDDDFTEKLLFFCVWNGIKFYDHIIIGQNEYYSYHSSGRLEQLRKKVRLKPE